jgi:phosphoribosylformylglycinamidine cyclo-ligase
LKEHGENAWLIGDIQAKDGEQQVEINAWALHQPDFAF